MTVTDYGRPAAFRIGRVFGDSFAVFGRNIVLCLALSLIFAGLPTLLYQGWIVSTTGTIGPEMAEFSSQLIWIPILGGLINFVLSSILQASLTRAAIEDLNGGRPTFGDCLSTALSVVVPVMLIALIMSIGIGFGFVLLIVPGIILLLRWAVAIPVQVHERLGVMASLSRSASLTKGNRWALLGLLVILIVVIIALQFGLGLLFAILASMFGTFGALVAMALVSSVSSVAFSIVAAVSYVELRLVKEGTDVKELAEIFA